MNASVRETMAIVGKALNDTFRNSHVRKEEHVSGKCTDGVVTINGVLGQPFDYVVTMEDLTEGQRIANYSVEYQAKGSGDWHILVPPALKNGTKPNYGDRPDGHDPRDQYVGHKRIDFPVINTTEIQVEAVRFNCIQSFTPTVAIRSFSLHKKQVPWE
mgnify:FL=1